MAAEREKQLLARIFLLNEQTQAVAARVENFLAMERRIYSGGLTPAQLGGYCDQIAEAEASSAYRVLTQRLVAAIDDFRSYVLAREQAHAATVSGISERILSGGDGVITLE